MTFDLSVPITWSDIISASASVFTFIAVIVAIVGNNNSNKQLKASLKIQEQSKNVELLEQRVKIADGIRNDKSISTTTLSVLFDEEICMFYDKLCDAKRRIASAKQDIQVYFEACDMTAEFHPENPVRDRIEEFEMYMARPDCPQSIIDRYRAYCNENEQWWSETGLSDDRRIYNHAEICDELEDATFDFQDAKTSILTLIEISIRKSIEPVKE